MCTVFMFLAKGRASLDFVDTANSFPGRERARERERERKREKERERERIEAGNDPLSSPHCSLHKIYVVFLILNVSSSQSTVPLNDKKLVFENSNQNMSKYLGQIPGIKF